MYCLIGDDQFAAVVHGMVLDQGKDGGAVDGEIGHHIEVFADDDLSVEDIVVGIIAMVDYIRELDHQTRGVALAVGASVGVVGREAVVGQKLIVAQFVDDDAAAGAFNVGCQVEPAADEVQFLVLQGVGIDGDVGRQDRPIGVLGEGMASLEEEKECH